MRDFLLIKNVALSGWSWIIRSKYWEKLIEGRGCWVSDDLSLLFPWAFLQLHTVTQTTPGGLKLLSSYFIEWCCRFPLPDLCPLSVRRQIDCLPACTSLCLSDTEEFRSVSVQIPVKQAKQMQKKVNLITLADSPPLAFSRCVILGSCNYTICLYRCPLLACNEVHI